MEETIPTPGQLDKLRKSGNRLCISMIMSANRRSPEKVISTADLQQAVSAIRSYLRGHYDDKDTDRLMSSLVKLSQENICQGTEGTGFFVSDKISICVPLYFPVKQRTTIANNFEVRDLIDQEYYTQAYYALQLGAAGARLFRCHMNFLQEVEDSNFPLSRQERFEFHLPDRSDACSIHLPSRGSALMERQNAEIDQLRYEAFVIQVDEELNNYLYKETPLVMAGPEWAVSAFNDLTCHINNIAGCLPDSRNHPSGKVPAGVCWNHVKRFLDRQKGLRLKDLETKVKEGAAITGMEKVWRAVKKGGAYSLCVEKDFAVSGFVNPHDDNLYLQKPQTAHATIPDAVNELMLMVLENNGEVVILENDSLIRYHRIAIIPRN